MSVKHFQLKIYSIYIILPTFNYKLGFMEFYKVPKQREISPFLLFEQNRLVFVY